MLESLVGVDAATTARVLGLLIPLLVAFITKKSASSGLKGVLNVVASAVIGSITYIVAENGGYDWTGFVNGTLDTLIPSVAAYYALWKPTGVAGTVANATENFGIGSLPTLQTDDVGAEDAGINKTDDGDGPQTLLGVTHPKN